MGRDDSWPAAGNAQNGGAVLPVAKMMADSEPETPISYCRFIALSRIVSEIFACDTQTDRQTDGLTTRIDALAVAILAGQLKASLVVSFKMLQYAYQI